MNRSSCPGRSEMEAGRRSVLVPKRRAWTAPHMRRLATSEAEFNSTPGPDAESFAS